MVFNRKPLIGMPLLITLSVTLNCELITLTRLPSNPWQTIYICMCSGRHGHFWSHDRDGGHTIRSPVAENTMMHAKFMSLSSEEPKLLPIKVLHCGNRKFYLFCCCDLDLDLGPMTFIFEHNQTHIP